MGVIGKIQKVKYAPPPPDLPTSASGEPKDIVYIGRTNYVAALDDHKYVFGIKRTDRRRHMYIIGKSGVGKSKFLELMLRQDVAYGHGLCLIDPHGDVIDAVLDFVPRERMEDVVVIDPSDSKFPVSFNPLANVDPDLKHQMTQGLIEVLEKQFGANWTPRLEHVFRFTCLALLDYPYATMRGMLMMLTDRNYRQKVIEYIEDDVVKRFWAIEFADWSEKFDTDAIIPLVNKLGQFLSNPMLRHIFGQQESKVDIEKLMNEKKMIFINLSKGRLGEENSSFFGSMFITKIKQAGMGRAKLPESARVDFYLYVDEFQNVVTDTFANILSEARKYGLCLVMAHQYVAQLIPEVEQAVRGNVGSMVIFRVGGDDAVSLQPEFAPIVEAKDLINLGLQEFYIKLLIDGETFDPFSAETLRVLPPTHPSYREEIMNISRSKYAVPVKEAKRLMAEEDKSARETKSVSTASQKSASDTQASPTEPVDETPAPLI
ncbi:MAG: hypothetical protein COV07_02040 [Candidatus Vogelbacteria bacterium CG10_big_fil_rev_8_21_14_0_10_45_14]|uniref:Type IV secretion system coupling protein TraD DNA-binding domain-containing protein n=1 Tax=Candidatus Vogelbacteria bacterium CG10_big_fil_rev_8_21_14_0_10_45_14 TaxID=1975042 RepID=A0A2H0RK43_9BACT|nr:MAG: hypothetical protein COV07_02040 [Candidatus Vogelbacteria bacterium CG10_big_fil_rev_8_21_14_0_10_45_14]